MAHNPFIKFPNFETIKNQIDTRAIKNYKHLLYKFLITNTEFEFENFSKISSIDDISENIISNSLFFLHFNTDDEYIYHLDKILKYNGKFIIQKNYAKYMYYHSNKLCKQTLMETVKYQQKGLISHFSVMTHGNICQAIEQTKHLNGDYVEIGVYKGGSALTALNYMKFSNIKKNIYLLDTFDGFNYSEAESSVETHWQNNNNHHRLYGPENTIKKINNVLSEACPNQHFEIIQSNICSDALPSHIQNIVVANIDVDLYDATKYALEKVADKIVKGGIIISEDPTSTPGLIGAFYAMETFLKTPIGKKFIKLHLTGQYFLIKME